MERQGGFTQRRKERKVRKEKPGSSTLRFIAQLSVSRRMNCFESFTLSYALGYPMPPLTRLRNSGEHDEYCLGGLLA
jgi:hypothetical protein